MQNGLQSKPVLSLLPTISSPEDVKLVTVPSASSVTVKVFHVGNAPNILQDLFGLTLVPTPECKEACAKAKDYLEQVPIAKEAVKQLEDSEGEHEIRLDGHR